MTAALLLLTGAWAEEPVPSLSTQLKRGLEAGVHSESGRVRITRVSLFPAVVEMTPEEVAERLAGDEPLAVGILETRNHGRLRITCLRDLCTGASGSATVEIRLIKDPVEEERGRRGARGDRDDDEERAEEPDEGAREGRKRRVEGGRKAAGFTAEDAEKR